MGRGPSSLQDCVLLKIEIATDVNPDGSIKKEPREALAVINDWAVTVHDLNKPKSERYNYKVTHVPTGRATSPVMSKYEALKTVDRLRDIVISVGDNGKVPYSDISEAIINAHPKKYLRTFTDKYFNPNALKQ